MSLEADFFQYETLSCLNASSTDTSGGDTTGLDFRDRATYAYQCGRAQDRKEQLTWLHLILIGVPFGAAAILFVVLCVLPLVNRRMDMTRLVRVGLPNVRGYAPQTVVVSGSWWGPLRPTLTSWGEAALEQALRLASDALRRPAPPFVHWFEGACEFPLGVGSSGGARGRSWRDRSPVPHKRAALRLVLELLARAEGRGAAIAAEGMDVLERLWRTRQAAQLRAAGRSSAGDEWEDLARWAAALEWSALQGEESAALAAGRAGVGEGGGAAGDDAEQWSALAAALDRRVDAVERELCEAARCIASATRARGESMRSYLRRQWEYGETQHIPTLKAEQALTPDSFASLVEECLYGPRPWTRAVAERFSLGYAAVSAGVNHACSAAQSALDRALALSAARDLDSHGAGNGGGGGGGEGGGFVSGATAGAVQGSTSVSAASAASAGATPALREAPTPSAASRSMRARSLSKLVPPPPPPQSAGAAMVTPTHQPVSARGGPSQHPHEDPDDEDHSSVRNYDPDESDSSPLLYR